MNGRLAPDPSLTRRDVLKAGGAALIALTGPQLRAAPAEAQTPKRGGTLRFTFQSDPVTGFDPQQTISFVTMVPLSFVYSRLVKVKAGPAVKPMTYPVEADLAESWTQPNETTYVFKLRKGVRWHPKPPVDGRELTAEDVKYTYDRFLTVKGNPNRPALDSVERIDVLDKHTVRFNLREPNAWFLDMLASTSTWIIAKECVEKFGDLKKVESVVGTGPWMLERWEPNVKMTFVRNPNYYMPGLPYADNVEMLIDKDPSSRLAAFLAGRTDFGPEYQQVVRRIDLQVVKQRKPGLQTAEYTWFTAGAQGLKIDKPPFNDIRVRRALARATNLQEVYDANAFSQGQWTPNTIVPAAFAEWSLPIDQLGPEGRKNYQHSIAEAKRLLAEAGFPNGVKVIAEAPGTGYGPDFLDTVQINVKGGRLRHRPAAEGVRGVHLEHHLREVRPDVRRPPRRLGRPRGLLLPDPRARTAPECHAGQRPEAHGDDQAAAAYAGRGQAPADRPRRAAVRGRAGVLRGGRLGQRRLGLGVVHQELHAQQRLRLRRPHDGRLDRQVGQRGRAPGRRAPAQASCATTCCGGCWSPSPRC
jgi:ABC-type transport system substrate-binding protein